MSDHKCSKCGGETDNGYIAARERNTVDYTTLNPATQSETITTEAYACLSCGNIELSVNPEHLRKLIGK